MKFRTGASIALALLVSTAAFPAAASARHHGRWWCNGRFYTPAHTETHARSVYRGTRSVSVTELRRLGYMEMCLKPSRSEHRVRAYDRRQGRLHDRRVGQANPISYTVASWFDDAGATASGTHYTYGFASCGSDGVLCVPFGTSVTFYYNGRAVTGIREDSGPYVSGRGVDLDQNLAQALGFDGVATVGYRINN